MNRPPLPFVCPACGAKPKVRSCRLPRPGVVGGKFDWFTARCPRGHLAAHANNRIGLRWAWHHAAGAAAAR